jgi:putative protease
VAWRVFRMAEEKKIGHVFRFFAKPSVAAIELTDGDLSIGETIRIRGHTTDLEQVVDSMQIDLKDIEKAEKGQAIGIKVLDRVRPNDVVYKVVG